MKNQAIAIWIYALVLMIGGLIGFLKAGSLASLLTATFFTAALIKCGISVKQSNPYAYNMSLVMLSLLLVFFIFRFISTYKFMPSGLAAILTFSVLAYLIVAKRTATNKLS